MYIEGQIIYELLSAFFSQLLSTFFLVTFLSNSKMIQINKWGSKSKQKIELEENKAMEKINTLMYINGYILLLEIHHRFDFLLSNIQKIAETIIFHESKPKLIFL